MKIIAIEGLDKSGKFSQSELLADALARKGYRVEKSEFHRYDTPTGKLIMDWLTKKWDVDQKTIELIMTADKQAQQKWFNQLEEDGVDFLILDRYTASQRAYSAANGISTSWTHALQEYMREPDYQIFIDIPGEVSMNRKGKHNNGENDRYESDVEMLERVREWYYKECTKEGAIYTHLIVDGEQSIEEIHAEIMDFVQAVILK